MKKTLLGYNHIGIPRLKRMGLLAGWSKDEIRQYIQDRKDRKKTPFVAKWNTPEGNSSALERIKKRGGCKGCDKKRLEKFSKPVNV